MVIRLVLAQGGCPCGRTYVCARVSGATHCNSQTRRRSAAPAAPRPAAPLVQAGTAPVPLVVVPRRRPGRGTQALGVVRRGVAWCGVVHACRQGLLHAR